jgi:beta-glucuronidase
MKRVYIIFIFIYLLSISQSSSQNAMINVAGRKTSSLNGKWKVIIDPFDVGIGEWTAI